MKTLLSLLAVSTMALALPACSNMTACQKCCKDKCAECCGDKGKTCGVDCCKK